MSLPPSSAGHLRPRSILIVGAGVFGLSTALALITRPSFSSATIIIVDEYAGLNTSNPHAASIDSSRIVRSDYANGAYSRLAVEAMKGWRRRARNIPGSDVIFHESGLLIVTDGDKSGDAYVDRSLENAKINYRGLDGVKVLKSREDITQAMNGAGGSGTRGFLNRSGGWAEAERAIADVKRRIMEVGEGRVTWVREEVTSLLYEDGQGQEEAISGVRCRSGSTLHADLTILATGAWTGKLIDLRGRAEATGQVMAYVQLSDEEKQRLTHMPALINMSTGMFIVPPTREGLLKTARHGFGYLNPTKIQNAENSSHGENPAGEREIELSLPVTNLSTIPAEGLEACRTALREMVPWLGDRDFCSTRVCWYTDTPKGDFIVDWHPRHKGLFVATGGSGHAFKFLPVLGEKIVDALEGTLEKELRALWNWPQETSSGWTGDGSRGGKRGMLFEEEVRRDGRREKSRL